MKKMRAQHVSYNNKYNQPVSEPWSVCHPHQDDKVLPSGSLLNICKSLIYIHAYEHVQLEMFVMLSIYNYIILIKV